MSKARELAELGAVYDSGALSNRNVIINGAMEVAQRGTSVTGVTSSGFNTVDRFQYAEGSGGGSAGFTISQSTEAPDGFGNSFKFEVTTTDTLTGGENCLIRTRLEGRDMQRFKFGSSSAESMTVSFFVRASLTGTYGLQVMVGPSSQRTAMQSYTVNSANTWEYKTITFAGSTDYAIPNDSSRGFDLNFMLDSGPDDLTAPYAFTSDAAFRAPTGQVNFVQTSGATFHVTGVQVEVGTEATPFEHRSFGQELALCQRYFYRTARGTTGSVDDAYIGIGRGGNASNTSETFFSHPVFMRASPTVTFDGNIVANDGSAMASSGVSTLEVGVRGGFVYGTGHASGITINEALRTYFQSDGEGMNVDAEL
tara:strand:+ start:1002 stop:2102 length:1101 start_codon:yes stop_codon:yes gene_type:complete